MSISRAVKGFSPLYLSLKKILKSKVNQGEPVRMLYARLGGHASLMNEEMALLHTSSASLVGSFTAGTEATQYF